MARYINKYETDSDYQDAITDNEYSGTTYDVANTSLINDTRRKKYDHKITLGTGSVLQSLNITGSSGFNKSTWLVGTNIASSNKLKNHVGFGGHLMNNTITNVDNVIREMTLVEIMHFEYSESNLTSVTIPEGVTHIYHGAFEHCKNLIEVKFPSTLQYIGKYAFKGCINLTSIVIPENVTVIDSSAFANCISLREVIFADGIDVQIRGGVFRMCKSLVSISLPDSVKTLNRNVFRECVSLKYIRFGSGLRYVLPGAFRRCISLEKIDISPNNQYFRTENGVTIMRIIDKHNVPHDSVVHVNAALTEVVIPSVGSIQRNVLRNCTNLRRITCLGINAPYRFVFGGCYSLESLTIHVKTHSNMTYSFVNCPNLTDLTIIPDEGYNDNGNFVDEYVTQLSENGEYSAFGTYAYAMYNGDHDRAISNIDLHVPSQYVQYFTNIGFNSVTAV